MYMNILVPVDIAHLAEAKGTVDLAMNNCAKGQGRVTLLNVIEDIPHWAAAQLPEGMMEQSRARARTALESLANGYEQSVEVEIRTGHTCQVILDTAREKKSELIVMLSHRPGFQEYYLGSNAAKVVRHAQCSVLVVR